MIQTSDYLRLQVLTRDDLPRMGILIPMEGVYIPVRLARARRITSVWPHGDDAVLAFGMEQAAWAFLEEEAGKSE